MIFLKASVMDVYSKINTPTTLMLNMAPCQFTQGGNKTTQALNHISTCHIINQSEYLNEFHFITIVFTNKSLVETEQWKSRTNIKFKNLNIHILSSKSGKNNNGFKNGTDLTMYFLNCNERNELPDILIMCSHSKRIVDILQLLKRFKQGIICLNINPIFGIIFDEVDKNISVVRTLLESDLIIKDDGKPGVLVYVMFITATAFKNFWDMLRDYQIDSLEFGWLQEQLINCDIDMNILNINYRRISDHQHIDIPYDTKDPVEYVKVVLPFINGLIYRKIIYAPSNFKTSSHEEMSRYFTDNGYICLIHNGTYKEFRFPNNNKKITIEEYKSNKFENVNNQIELRDILVEFAKEYSMYNIAITGFLTIERGITFNTTGFQFTHMIFSKNHMKNKATLVQMFGRGNGTKKYVDEITIICPLKLIETVNSIVENIEHLINVVKPKTVNAGDFKNIHDENYKAKTKPIIYKLSNKKYKKAILKIKVNYDKNGEARRDYEQKGFKKYIFEKLSNDGKYSKYFNENMYNLTNLRQVSMPLTDGSYKKHITDAIKKHNQNSKFIIDAKFKGKYAKMKTMYNWWVYVDTRNKQFIILRWDGQKLLK
jgi:hypothetical protein